MPYGLNLPASNIAPILEKQDVNKQGIKTWQQLFGGASLNAAGQSDALLTNYSKAMSEAYETNLQKENIIKSQGLIGSSVNNLLGVNREDLVSAYNTYIGNYKKDATNIAEGYTDDVTNINTALQERAQNFSNLADSTYKYLSEELYGSTLNNEDYLTSKGLSNYLTVDEAGETTLKDWDTLKNDFFDPVTGNMTLEGVKFYDAIINATPQGFTKADTNEVKAFDEWLAESNPELREWMASEDIYNYNFAGSNLGTFNTMTGRKSTDQTFTENEYGVKTEDVLKTASGFGKFNVKDDLIKTAKNGDKYIQDTDKAVEYVDNYTSTIKKQYTDLKTQIKNALGINDFNKFWEQYGKKLDNALINMNNITIPYTIKEPAPTSKGIKMVPQKDLDILLNTITNVNSQISKNKILFDEIMVNFKKYSDNLTKERLSKQAGRF